MKEIILKNTTLSDIELKVLGITIPASGQVEIATTDYALLISDDSYTEISTLVNSGDVVVNNGTSDLFTEKALNTIQYQANLSPSNTVYISTSGSNTTGDGTFVNPYADLTGVKNALDAGDYTSSSSNPLVIKCDAGVYSQAPVDFSSYTHILISGSGPRTRFSASNANSDLLTLGSSSSIRSISLEGVTNSANWLVKYSTTSDSVGSIDDIFFTNASNCLKTENTTGDLFVTCHNALANSITGTAFQANSNTSLTVSGFSGIGDINSAIGFDQVGSGKLYVFTVKLTNFHTDVQITGDTGSIDIYSHQHVGTGRVINQIGDSLIKVFLGDYNLKGSVIKDVSKYEGVFYNSLENDKQLRFLSELSVGSPSLGKESSFGEGASYVQGMLVYTYNGSTFTDVTDEAKTASGSTFAMPGTSVDNAIYITTAFSTISPLLFYGLKMDITTAAVLGSGDIVFEYYNGTSWVEFNHMMTEANNPHKPQGNSKLEDTGQKHIYFDSTISTSWQTNDPISLGTNLYWIRIRVESTITTAPVLEQVKIHTSHMEIESDGFQTMKGLSRIKEKFPITFTGFAPVVGKAPTAQDVYLSDNLGISYTKNLFPTNQNRSIIFTQFIPFELDTSCPLELTVSYFINSASSGTAVFRVRWATSNPGSNIYISTATAPTVADNERTQITNLVFGTNEDRVEKNLVFNLSIPEAISQNTSGDPDAKIWIELERVTDNPSDNYGGSVIVTDIALFFTAWREGGYTGEFT